MNVANGANSDAIIWPAIAAAAGRTGAAAPQCKSASGARRGNCRGANDTITWTDGRMDGQTRTRTDGQTGACQDHLFVLVFKWLHCREGRRGWRRTVLERGWRDAEMPQLPRFVAAAVIVVWRGKERVDTTQLSLEKEERSRWGGREGGTEGGRGKEVRVETSFGVTRCKHIVWQNGAAAAATAAPTGLTD